MAIRRSSLCITHNSDEYLNVVRFCWHYKYYISIICFQIASDDLKTYLFLDKIKYTTYIKNTQKCTSAHIKQNIKCIHT